MQDQLIIPSKLHVGFDKRADTYTGKLAYLIYTDAKGVKRKEKSWETWRDKTLEPKDFENVPTSGFVLNKKVGDYKSDWNHRRAAIRIYDPRDFEFEIQVENLLFILEQCSAIKGKGLEGEFVYAWEGTELVLLPTCSQEFQLSTKFTKLQSQKVTQKEMKEGCVYLTKEQHEVLYLGRHDWYNIEHQHVSDKTAPHGYKYLDYCSKHSKQHIFIDLTRTQEREARFKAGKPGYGETNDPIYWIQSGFTKLGSRLSEEPSPLFADAYESFMKTIHGSAPNKLIATSRTFKIDAHRFSSFYACRKKGDDFYPVSICAVNSYYDYRIGGQKSAEYRIMEAEKPIFLASGKELIVTDVQKLNYYDRNQPGRPVTLDEAKKMEFYDMFVETEKKVTIPLLYALGE